MTTDQNVQVVRIPPYVIARCKTVMNQSDKYFDPVTEEVEIATSKMGLKQFLYAINSHIVYFFDIDEDRIFMENARLWLYSELEFLWSRLAKGHHLHIWAKECLQAMNYDQLDDDFKNSFSISKNILHYKQSEFLCMDLKTKAVLFFKNVTPIDMMYMLDNQSTSTEDSTMVSQKREDSTITNRKTLTKTLMSLHSLQLRHADSKVDYLITFPQTFLQASSMSDVNWSDKLILAREILVKEILNLESEAIFIQHCMEPEFLVCTSIDQLREKLSYMSRVAITAKKLDHYVVNMIRPCEELCFIGTNIRSDYNNILKQLDEYLINPDVLLKNWFHEKMILSSVSKEYRNLLAAQLINSPVYLMSLEELLVVARRAVANCESSPDKRIFKIPSYINTLFAYEDELKSKELLRRGVKWSPNDNLKSNNTRFHHKEQLGSKKSTKCHTKA